jgi:hypothetical protein
MSLRALCCTAILALGATTACVDQLPVSPITPPKAIAHDMIACDPTTAIIPCDGDSGGGGGGYAPPPGIPLPGLSMTMCLNVTSYPDSDHDGLNDVCELSLAQAFAPRLYQNPNLRIWDPSNGWIGGEYYHGAAQMTYYDYGYHPFIRLAYFPAYYNDMGNCPINCGHEGDSEFIMVDLEYDASSARFLTRGVFLSAHCGAIVPVTLQDAKDCRWYTPDFFAYVDGVYRGAPEVWVANGTNANYPSLGRCDSGTYNYDDCSSYAWGVRFPVTADFNFGAVGYTIGAVHARRNLSMTNPSRTEHFFDRLGVFGGWQSGATDTTPYGRILYDFGFIPSSGGGGTPGCNASGVCYL